MRFIFFLIVFIFFFVPKSPGQDKKTIRLIHKIEKKLNKPIDFFNTRNHPGKIKPDSVYVDRNTKTIKLYYNKSLSYIPFRENIVENAQKSIKKQLGWWLRKYHVEIYSDKKNIQEYIPNIYRKKLPLDSSRFTREIIKKNPLISRTYLLEPAMGLLNKNIAVWHSHGRYYDAKQDRWRWQRPRLHSTAEDIFPLTFVLDYIEPMLENAGATVFIPRERDINTNEIILDNDSGKGKYSIQIDKNRIDTIMKITGFSWKDTLFNSENPFEMGTSMVIVPLKNKEVHITLIPEIPADGEYSVYISYGESTAKNVKYTVVYSGGKKDFIINQTQGNGTWIYLDKFYFKKGKNPETASIILESDKSFNFDAVKIGGGTGNVARRPSAEIKPKAWSLKGKKKSFFDDKNKKVNPENFTWKTSNMPRYMEAARYYLQYCGMPDSIVYSLSHGQNDYNDDYQSRGEWVNYLMGKPNGPTGDPDVKGLGIPIDMALAFHTDAGITSNDSIIGTLAIYSSDNPDTIFPSGQSKMANRDLVDLVQTQIVNDIRYLDNPKWTRRGIWNKPYSEAWRANTPMMLLELLSHQNLADLSYGLDHRFKFDVARAIYKGILKYIAFQNHQSFVVQPLPVDHFSIQITGGKNIRLSWNPVSDPLEPTAEPSGYIVYQRNENNGFDTGKFVKNNFIEIELPEFDKLYSFKVTAVNRGGESFPSEVLSAGIINNQKPAVLIVNAFDRVSAPAIIEKSDFAGFAYWQDSGVPYHHEIGLTGMPYDFNRQVPWIDDDNPGWGASFANLESKEISGNIFDYPSIHGKSILNAGYSFTSVSDEAFSQKTYNANIYEFVDVIFGEERTIKTLNRTDFTVFTPEIINKLKEILDKNGNIFLSGAYIGSDFIENKDTVTQKFVNDILHYKWRTNFASHTGNIVSTDYANKYFNGNYNFNTTLNNKIYQVEAPDGIEPAGDNCITAFRYMDTGISAGVIYSGKNKIITLGFPFETISGTKQRNKMMAEIIHFFEN